MQIPSNIFKQTGADTGEETTQYSLKLLDLEHLPLLFNNSQ